MYMHLTIFNRQSKMNTLMFTSQEEIVSEPVVETDNKKSKKRKTVTDFN